MGHTKKKKIKKLAFLQIRQCFEGTPPKRGGEGDSDTQKSVQRHRRTQSVLKRRPPHPARLTGARKQKLPTLTWYKGKQSMSCEQLRHILIRAGMHLRSKMVQCNWFPNKLLELVGIFTVRLMMTMSSNNTWSDIFSFYQSCRYLGDPWFEQRVK